MIAAAVLIAIGLVLLFATLSALAHLIGWICLAVGVACLIVVAVRATGTRVP